MFSLRVQIFQLFIFDHIKLSNYPDKLYFTPVKFIEHKICFVPILKYKEMFHIKIFYIPAVAVAFQEKLILHPELKEICMKFYNTSDVKCPGMKLAYVSTSVTSVF